MADNAVVFDLELAVKDFNQNLKSVDKNLGNFHNSFKKQAKNSNAAWSSFVGNLSADAVAFAVRGLTSLARGMANFTEEAILAAVDAEETASKFEAVFSAISESSDQAAKDLQKNYGLGVTESKELLSATGDLLTGFGFAQDGALDLSTEVQKLSVDLASFTNFSGGAKGASEAITKALLGERESIKALGVSIQEKDVLQQVAINRAAGLTFETERQAKAHATLQLITKQSGNAIGDYAKTSGGAANQLKLFDKRMEDLTISFGKNFIPAIQPVIQMVNEFIEELDEEQISKFVKDGILLLIDGLIAIIPHINPVITAFKNMGSIFNIIQNGITAGLATIGLALSASASGWVEIFRSMLEALPSSLVPDGWIEGLDTASAALDETMKDMVEQISTDSNDMSASLNDIVNPENMISEEKLELLNEKLTTVKDAVIASRAEVETAEMAALKRKAARDKAEAARQKKITDDENKVALKNSAFKEELFGKQLSWEETGGKERAQNLKSTLGTMATLSKSGNKTLATIGKAAAISTATIDGFAAVQKALAAAPPPINFALAGVVGAATAANIASIAGVNFANGGIVGGSSFTGDQVGINVNSKEMVLNQGQQAQLFQLANNGGGGGGNGSVIEAINALGDRIANMEIVLQADDNEIARSTSRGVEAGVVIGRS